MNRITIATIALFLLALTTYGILEWFGAEKQTSNILESANQPEFIAENLNSDVYKSTGPLSYNVEAQRMEHYAQLEVTHFEYPRYTLYPKNNKPTWQITANEGTLYNNNRVKLKNRVRLIATDEESLIQEVHGKNLEMDLKTNIISSEQTILILGKGFTMYGSGLIVDLNTTQMTLTEHVQTIYKKIKK
ncbi:MULTISPECIES: LPS export ABC transporter periplasmic protein LptC [unclassified Colwellia]|jgi:lipopolysaccharide export system protein LptC|uniref:LPS export ABC transporter periplasmic protein LptC n=1 Tax=unclassified Colwellia TaxID=196834 RepID=UPI000D36D9D1|nr:MULTISPECIES: LPS export ABC transporter periplasmic protein LptC [unclassified Colwellia]AWB59063.1 LPS export ABC transporter periplasmic protein LptC [Colwellia sp. Arc7-D]MBA6414631.1 LPS export ABC transporter periplasmic protein LptC [Colwellia sp. 6M3]|tara:strand:+ start:1059 stop:1625 length:567 start_codon:yes stop_codon:yes gene_type:complete